MRKFIFIVGAIACGKSIFIENKLFNTKENLINYFDPDKAKLMVQLYAQDKGIWDDLNLAKAFNNSIEDSIQSNKDFAMQMSFTTDQLDQIDYYLCKYNTEFEFIAHFIGVSNVEILKQRAHKRKLLGGHSSDEKAIDKAFKESFNHFITYLPKFKVATIWDNTKDFGFHHMKKQLLFENGQLVFKDDNLTVYSKQMLDTIL